MAQSGSGCSCLILTSQRKKEILAASTCSRLQLHLCYRNQWQKLDLSVWDMLYGANTTDRLDHDWCILDTTDFGWSQYPHIVMATTNCLLYSNLRNGLKPQYIDAVWMCSWCCEEAKFRDLVGGYQRMAPSFSLLSVQSHLSPVQCHKSIGICCSFLW